MTRRELLKTAAAAALVPFSPNQPQAPRKPSRNYVWMRPSMSRSADDWKRDFEVLRAAGIHGIVPEIYNGRTTLFKSTRLPVRATWLNDTLPLARAAGLEVHAWMWCMPCLIPTSSRSIPDWYNVNAKGESAVRQAGLRRLLQVSRSGPDRSSRVRARHGSRARGNRTVSPACTSTTSGTRTRFCRRVSGRSTASLQDKRASAVRLRLHGLQPPRFQREDGVDPIRLRIRKRTASGCSTGSTRWSIS